MAELADALDLGSSGQPRAGSSPVIRINGCSGRSELSVNISGGRTGRKKTEILQNILKKFENLGNIYVYNTFFDRNSTQRGEL